MVSREEVSVLRTLFSVVPKIDTKGGGCALVDASSMIGSILTSLEATSNGSREHCGAKIKS